MTQLQRIRKAVFPVAGLGTRFLPATKTVPKEMLPIIDRPLIQYAVDEAIEAGCDTLVFVTNRYKHAVADYFDKAYELEQKLEQVGQDRAARAGPQRAAAHVRAVFVTQAEALGLGHAVLCAKPVIGDEPFAVLLPDDLIWNRGPGALKQMADVAEATGASVIAVQDVPREQTSSYGIVAHRFLPGRAGPHHARSSRSRSPKSRPARWPWSAATCCSPRIFDLLERRTPGAGGEIQLTDAIAALLAEEPVIAYRFQGTRFDCGTHIGLIEATIRYALDHEKLSDSARQLMQNALDELVSEDLN